MKASAVPELVRQAMRTLNHALNIDQRAWPEVRTQRVLNAIEQAIAGVDPAERGYDNCRLRRDAGLLT